MAFFHSKISKFFIYDSSTTIRDISAYLTSIDFPQTADTAEVTAFSTGATPSKDYVAGFKDATITIEGNWDATIDGYLEGIVGLDSTADRYHYYPESTAAGKVHYSGPAILNSYNPRSAVADAAKFTAGFQCKGYITRSTT
ncbi:MAG: hypothetical protein M0R06_20295 [Sphaerochaeta sp.]|jgi:hypothetical protein|nr:hypothetical protein [Sphaerochaeta sp.]